MHEYTRLSLMIDQKKIDLVISKLVATYSPLAIYLFGSYAWGDPTDVSDLDLLVIIDKSNEKSYRRSVKGYHALFGLKVPTDILVNTKEEFENRADKIPTLFYKIRHQGKLVYGNL